MKSFPEKGPTDPPFKREVPNDLQHRRLGGFIKKRKLVRCVRLSLLTFHPLARVLFINYLIRTHVDSDSLSKDPPSKIGEFVQTEGSTS